MDLRAPHHGRTKPQKSRFRCAASPRNLHLHLIFHRATICARPMWMLCYVCWCVFCVNPSRLGWRNVHRPNPLLSIIIIISLARQAAWCWCPCAHSVRRRFGWAALWSRASRRSPRRSIELSTICIYIYSNRRNRLQCRASSVGSRLHTLHINLLFHPIPSHLCAHKKTHTSHSRRASWQGLDHARARSTTIAFPVGLLKLYVCDAATWI